MQPYTEKDRNAVPVVKKRTGTPFRCVPARNEHCMYSYIVGLDYCYTGAWHPSRRSRSVCGRVVLPTPAAPLLQSVSWLPVIYKVIRDLMPMETRLHYDTNCRIDFRAVISLLLARRPPLPVLSSW